MVNAEIFYNSLTYTSEQCTENFMPVIIVIFIGIFIFFISTMTLIYINQNKNTFIKENKLEEKFQKWKENNKGLI